MHCRRPGFSSGDPSYLDFRSAIIEMPNRQTLGGSMGLPRKDPDYIPYDMNEEILKKCRLSAHITSFLFLS